MSRLGKMPIPLPKGVELKITEGKVEVRGKEGMLEQEIPRGILVRVEGLEVFVDCDSGSSIVNKSAVHGLYRSLLANAICGVSQPFEKRLDIVGVGYRASVQGNTLDLQLGFSHPCRLQIPEGLQVTVEGNTSIRVKGIDKQLVGQFSANIRGSRPPEPYKGKGIRYVGEYVRKKAGKAAKGGK